MNCENDIEEDKLFCRWNSIVFQQDCTIKKKKEELAHTLSRDN